MLNESQGSQKIVDNNPKATSSAYKPNQQSKRSNNMIPKQILLATLLLACFFVSVAHGAEESCKPTRSRCQADNECCSKGCEPINPGSFIKFCEAFVVANPPVVPGLGGCQKRVRAARRLVTAAVEFAAASESSPAGTQSRAVATSVEEKRKRKRRKGLGVISLFVQVV